MGRVFGGVKGNSSNIVGMRQRLRLRQSKRRREEEEEEEEGKSAGVKADEPHAALAFLHFVILLFEDPKRGTRNAKLNRE